MNNINSGNESIDEDVAKNDDRPCVDVSVSAAEAFAKSCEEIRAFCPDDDEDDSPAELATSPPSAQVAQPEHDFKIEELRAKIAAKLDFASAVPHIAILLYGGASPNEDDPRNVLLNGNWDMSNDIPILEATMHNANLEELQVLKELTMSQNQVECSGTGLGGKQMKLDTSSVFASGISANIAASSSVFTGTPSPLGSDSGIEGDSTDGNLSWLLNYKINELPPVPEQQQAPAPPVVPVVPIMQKVNDPHKQPALMTVEANIQYEAVDEQGNVIELQNKGFAMLPTIHPQSERYHQFVGAVASAPPTGVAKYSGPKKPPFTYTELIEHALVEKGELTVSGIYQWISDHFPFYKQNDDRWKNSVRHNLSINPHFRKGSKAVHGAGHLWTIAQKEDHQSWQIKRQKMQQFIKNSAMESSTEKLQEMELANATASILPSTLEAEIGGHAKHIQPENVAIEYVIDMSGGMGDFLCPSVTKEQVVEECCLAGDYFITDLHPATLGFNLSDAGELLHAGGLYDELNFPPSYELQSE